MKTPEFAILSAARNLTLLPTFNSHFVETVESVENFVESFWELRDTFSRRLQQELQACRAKYVSVSSWIRFRLLRDYRVPVVKPVGGMLLPLFLITSVCKDGVDASSFRVVEAAAELDIAQAMLDDPYAWESLLNNTEMWWDLTRYEYKYNEPLDWSATDMLDKIEATWMDGDSSNQVRIHEIADIERIPASMLTEFAQSANSTDQATHI